MFNTVHQSSAPRRCMMSLLHTHVRESSRRLQCCRSAADDGCGSRLCNSEIESAYDERHLGCSIQSDRSGPVEMARWMVSWPMGCCLRDAMRPGPMLWTTIRPPGLGPATHRPPLHSLVTCTQRTYHATTRAAVKHPPTEARKATIHTNHVDTARVAVTMSC